MILQPAYAEIIHTSHSGDIFMLWGQAADSLYYIVLYITAFSQCVLPGENKQSWSDQPFSSNMIKSFTDLPVCSRKWSKWTRHFYIARSKGSSWKKTQRRKYSNFQHEPNVGWSDSASNSVHWLDRDIDMITVLLVLLITVLRIITFN